MGKAQRNYAKEYKEQAVKLAKEIGVEKAARELGVPKGTLYGWMKAVREGRLDAGPGSRTPNEAVSLAEEMTALRQQMKVLERENRRLKEENEFLAEASAFFAASRRRSVRNEVPCAEDVRWRGEGEAVNVLPSSGSESAGVLCVSCPAKPAQEAPGVSSGHAGNS